MAGNNNEFHLKRNDTLPVLKMQLIDRSCLGSRIPFDLTGVSGATFTMKNSCGDIKIMAKNAQIISYSGGVIQYNWEAEDTRNKVKLNMYNKREIPIENYKRIEIGDKNKLLIE